VGRSGWPGRARPGAVPGGGPASASGYRRRPTQVPRERAGWDQPATAAGTPAATPTPPRRSGPSTRSRTAGTSPGPDRSGQPLRRPTAAVPREVPRPRPNRRRTGRPGRSMRRATPRRRAAAPDGDRAAAARDEGRRGAARVLRCRPARQPRTWPAGARRGRPVQRGTPAAWPRPPRSSRRRPAREAPGASMRTPHARLGQERAPPVHGRRAHRRRRQAQRSRRPRRRSGRLRRARRTPRTPTRDPGKRPGQSTAAGPVPTAAPDAALCGRAPANPAARSAATAGAGWPSRVCPRVHQRGRRPERRTGATGPSGAPGLGS
jgi:hypothetical protein